ncbi:E3 ubiquitin-protein ligase RNF130-like [Cryptotermes secundus]|uniref:E3 ubiquitin-protein ligase RNF130-like n=1 Tax=Cryptotermes secundus TaxID=105785 RepID=UPI000CD7D6FE|nr:E3 ubiquitin-protein ligase RNF130-like [Cryptotermes secundus]
MPYEGLGFAVILGVGLATAIYYFLTQTGRESAHSNSRNNGQPPPFDHGPNSKSWHEGSRNTKPKRKLSTQAEETHCMICLEGYNIKQLPCKHRFHSHCISKWFSVKGSPSCPLCRALAE